MVGVNDLLADLERHARRCTPLLSCQLHTYIRLTDVKAIGLDCQEQTLVEGEVDVGFAVIEGRSGMAMDPPYDGITRRQEGPLPLCRVTPYARVASKR